MPLDTAKRSRDLMKQLGREAAKLLDGYRAARLKVSAEWNPSTRRELLATIAAAARAQVTELQMTHRQAAETFQAEIDRARGKPSAMGTNETAGWERLRSHLEAAAARGSTTPAAQTAMLRLERAAKEGDVAMIRAGRTMLPDFLGEPLARDYRRWLDIQGGDAETVEAVTLDEEGRKGVPWTRQAIDWVAGEVEGKVDNVTLLPEWSGTTVALADAPDYAAVQRAATANAAETLAAAGYRPTAQGGIANTGGSGPAPAPAGATSTTTPSS
ncbi:MAG: hypothetical protein AABZ33_07650 [Chloroflexota bacterium]